MHAPVTIPHTHLRNLLDPSLKTGLLMAAGLVMIRLRIDFQNPAGTPDRYASLHASRAHQLALASRFRGADHPLQ